MKHIDYILSIYNVKLSLSYITKFVHYWSELGNVKIIIMKTDLEDLKQDILKRVSINIDETIFIPYDSIKDVPNTYILSLLKLFYPCILDKDLEKKVLVVPITTLVKDIDIINSFEQTIISNSNKFIKHNDDKETYYCSKIKNWVDIFKIRDISNINFTISYLYNTLENDSSAEDLSNYFYNKKIDMWREKKTLYLKRELKYSNEGEVDKLINELLNNGIPSENDKTTIVNDINKFNIIYPYHCYRDINDFILDKYFSNE